MRIILILIYNISNIHKMCECECESFSFSFDNSWQYLKYLKELAWLLQSFLIFKNLHCISIQYLNTPILYIHPHSQRPRIALYGPIFFLVLGYRFWNRLSLSLSVRLTILKILAHFLHVPLSFWLGMLVACTPQLVYLHYISTILPRFIHM